MKGNLSKIFLLIMFIMLIGIWINRAAFKEVSDTNTESTDTENSETKTVEQSTELDEEYKKLLEELGVDPSLVTGDITAQDLSNDAIVKSVESFRTRADAEASMGYKLGLLNDIACAEEYELVAMYSIGNGAWYQAVYEDTSVTVDEHNESITPQEFMDHVNGETNLFEEDKADKEYHELEKLRSNLIVKTTDKYSLDTLLLPYNISNYNEVEHDIDGVHVDFYGTDFNTYLAAFKYKDRYYTLYVESGIGFTKLYNIVKELINNSNSFEK